MLRFVDVYAWGICKLLLTISNQSTLILPTKKNKKKTLKFLIEENENNLIFNLREQVRYLKILYWS